MWEVISVLELLVEATYGSSYAGCCAETTNDDGCSSMDTSSGTCYQD